ncbi:arylformamidase [Pontixanthobacter aestiaquae]|uniref:Kynurenine formamidase n=1 Tax=Pontixanthobacter aestiaquae TaxID=1509367 RepID=A0A844Z560_9SPHN|nr:arylformamidase [Pontixanthobacter aestiaquae]MDN3647101.1 arylformamidase [Pontixanthobacter aestiaquae]MXO81923.1 arylformamidase [Pontixanthobacter aestiaquae]
MNRKIWDISQKLRPGLPVWPGDTEFAHEGTWAMGDGSPVNVSKLTMSTHSGTHADAPLHYDEAGLDSAASDLTPYIGECLVVDARGVGSEIDVGDLPHIDSADRVLFRTYETFPHNKWEEDFTAIAAETIKWLSVQGVTLVGIDTPSIDPQNSKTMDAHKAVLAADMRILEGLVLDDVPEGRYELIALPLPIVGADASPIRAILRELP